MQFTEMSKEINVFKAPPDANKISVLKKKRKAKVLEEDEYVEKVEKIIERDFFPELDKLKAQSDYIDAAERKDTTQMQRLRERFSTNRINRLESPAGFEDHGEFSRKNPEETPKSFQTDPDDERDKELKGVSLDQFLSKHTSEDNESFHDLMEEQREEFERTHSWMFKKEEQLSIEDKKTQLTLPSIEDQSATKSEKRPESKPLDGWTYKNENAVFYHPRGAPLSDREKIEIAKKERVINRENTRFKSNPWKMSEAQRNNLVAAKKEAESGKVGVDGKDLVDPKATPSVNGYKLLRIDNPTPQINPDESPFMTWGEVESTPYRLEGADDDGLPINTGGGPQFKIQDIPKRDRLALELAEKNSKFYRDKKNKAIEKARSHMKTPKKGSLTMRVATMSPAAQRLATSKLGIRIGTDKALKAAYTPSPARKSVRSTPTPSRTRDLINASVSRATPKSERSSSTPRLDQQSESITDNLLNLPSCSSSANRSKASDFM